MEESKFTWFPKFTKQLELVPEELQAQLVMACIKYGTYGIEPEFNDWSLIAIFEGMKEDIDNSKAARTSNKGGRPPKKNGGFETQKQGFLETETGVFEDKNGGFEDAKPIPYQSIPNQTNNIKEKINKKEKFKPPTIEEAEAYSKEANLNVDAKAFLEYFSDPDRNWTNSNGKPVKNWKLTMRTWNTFGNGRPKPQGSFKGGENFEVDEEYLNLHCS